MGNVKSFKVDPAKALWRERIVDFVKQHYTPNQIRNFRVLCFAGREMTEVFDVYDKLGVKRKNVVSLECDPREYDAMCAVNETLEQKIKIVPATALEYLSHQATQPFDVISLDYCGYFNDDKVLTISKIALQGWLSSKAALFTNYQAGRENVDVQNCLRISGTYAKAHRDLVKAGFKDHLKFLDESGNTPDNETELGKLRDSMVQSTPVAEMVHGKGFWNTNFFNFWMQGQKADTQETIKEIVERINLGREPDLRELLAKFVVEQQERTSALLMTYLMKSQMKSFDCTAREAYKYISDSGMPMISDFYLFEEEIWDVSKKGRQSITYEQTPKGPVIRIKDSNKVAEILQKAERHVKAMTKRALMEGDTQIRLERVLLEPRLDTQLEEVGSKNSNSNRQMYDRTQIYEALAAGRPDEEITSNYGLTKKQLAGCKAAYTKLQRQTGQEQERKNATPFATEDLEIIASFLAEGYKATEIAPLFMHDDGTLRYSWQSIAAYKGQQGKTNGRISNELLFRRMKPEIMERDGHACQWCNKTADVQRGQSGHTFHVHHINYNHDDTRPDNLITLCTSCHARTNIIQYGGRDEGIF